MAVWMSSELLDMDTPKVGRMPFCTLALELLTAFWRAVAA